MACGATAQAFGLAVVKVGAGSGTVISAPAGIICGASCSGSYPSGTVATLTATPATGSTFTGWSGGGCTGTGSCTVTVTATTTVTATFALSQSVSLAVSTSGTGSGSISSTPAGINCGTSCSASYTSGTSVTLTANPAAGSVFTGWSGGCTGTGSCTVTLTSAATVTATFALWQSVTLAINAPAVTYPSSAVIRITASSPAGTPTGAVSLVVDGGAPLSATLSNGQAQFTLASPSVGNHTLSARYPAQGTSGASSAAGTLHVNAAAPTSADPLLFSSATYSVSETRYWAVITVLRQGPTKLTTAVTYATSDGTARARIDYRPVSGTLTFRPGETSRTFAVPIINNAVVDGSRTVNLTLSNPTAGALLGTPSAAVLTIVNDDVAGTVSFGAASYSVTEAGRVTINVVRKGRAGGVMVKYTIGGGTAAPGVDYKVASGTLTFGAGVTSRSFTIQTLKNPLVKARLTALLTLSNPQGGATLGTSTAVLTINNRY